FSEGGARGGLSNSQAHFRSGDVLAAEQPQVADAGAFGEFRPLAVFPLIEGEALDSLTQRQVLAKADYVEGNRLPEFQDQLRRGHSIVGSPIRGAIAIQESLGRISAGAPANIAGGYFGRLGEVAREGGIQNTAELP